MRVNPKVLFEYAKKKKIAIGAFNFVNFESIKGIVEAACETKTPVILSVSEAAVNYLGLNTITGMANGLISDMKNLKKQTKFALHLDHGKSFEICKLCIDAGFDSVMIDASELTFEENIKLTKKVVTYAHNKGVFVEGELGKLAGVEDSVNVKEKDAFFTSSMEAIRFIEETGVDSLAISIGTSHGAYKIKNPGGLKTEIAAEIKKLCPRTYLVLHGASSISNKQVEEFNKTGGSLENTNGIAETEIKRAIKAGISKINVDSDIRMAFTTAVRKTLNYRTKEFDIRKYLSPGTLAIKKLVEYKIQQVFKT